MGSTHHTRLILGSIIFMYAHFALAENPAQLELRGTVPLNCTVKINPSAKAANLDMLAGETSSVVGTLTENCNASNGYLVKIVSSNKGKLTNTANTAVGTDYKVQYDTANGSIANAVVATRDRAQFGRQGQLAVSFSGSAQPLAGSYSDILSVIISAK